MAVISPLRLTSVVQSPGFWGVVGLLSLNCLLLLAEYGPQAWRFWRDPTFLPSHPFPLTQRFEQPLGAPSVEWPDLLNQLQPWLLKYGFAVQRLKKDQLDILEATKRAWAWWGVPISGLAGIILVIALLVSYYNTQLEQLTLYPDESQYQPLLDHTISLPITVDGGTQLMYSHGQAEINEESHRLGLYQPTLMNGAILLPVALEPVLTVRVEDEANHPVRLIPMQEELNPDDILHLDVGDSGTPLYFRIPSADLTLQITPNAEADYNIQARRPTEDAPSTNIVIAAGERFQIENLAAKITLNRKATLIVYRNSGWWLYLLSGLCFMVGLWNLLIQPPAKLLVANQPEHEPYLMLEAGGVRNQGEQFWQALLSIAKSETEAEPRSLEP